MGREIRRVIPNWEHPKTTRYDYRLGREVECFKPLLDDGYKAALDKWIAENALWDAGEHPDQKREKDTPKHYADWGGNPPDIDSHRPDWNEEEATWFQVYETVSEGTPVTPPFATKEELIEYLVANGDYWDQERRARGESRMACAPWPREQAERFVASEWAPSFVVAAGQIKSGVDAI